MGDEGVVGLDFLRVGLRRRGDGQAKSQGRDKRDDKKPGQFFLNQLWGSRWRAGRFGPCNQSGKGLRRLDKSDR